MNKGINVLSLFDGISCGQIALQRAGIKVNKYFASEIDKHAIKVTQHNWPNTIQLGDVTKWREWDIDWKSIDLLCAGFPCQAWSFAGKQQGTNDPRGALAITLFELFTFLKEENPKLKFLFENVKMKIKYLDYLNNLFGVEPIEIDSALLSAQRRKRFYWTNIEGITQPKNRNILFKDVCEKTTNYTWIPSSKTQNRTFTKNYLQYDINGLGNKSQSQRASFFNNKTLTLDTTAASNAKVLDNGEVRLMTLKECERLQTVNEGYTNCISVNRAKKCLGNGWTVDVIAHIFLFLPEEFKNG